MFPWNTCCNIAMLSVTTVLKYNVKNFFVIENSVVVGPRLSNSPQYSSLTGQSGILGKVLAWFENSTFAKEKP